MPRQKRAVRYAGLCPAHPARGTPPETPGPAFPAPVNFRNGPRRKGFAVEILFKFGKEFPPPRQLRAPLTAPGRSETPLISGKAGFRFAPFSGSRWSPPTFSFRVKDVLRLRVKDVL